MAFIANDQDPQAEDKGYESLVDESLSVPDSQNECFYCGQNYFRRSAILTGVPVDYSDTYCSKACWDNDTDRMTSEIIPAEQK